MDVALNGSPLGRVENMHRTYEFDVTYLLLEGDNLLTITLRSPARFLREESANGVPGLRKARCMFGWEGGPLLPDGGLWRPVS